MIEAATAERTPGITQAVILLIASGLTTLMTAILGPTLPAMQLHFAAVQGVRYWVPLAVTAPLLVMAVCSVFAGAAADRYGRKRLLLSGAACYALLGTAPLWLDSVYAIVASRALVGLADAAVMTCSLTLIGDYWSGVRRERLLALQTTVGAGSAVILNLVGGALGSTWGWRAPFAVYGVALLLALAIQLSIWEPPVARGLVRVGASSHGAADRFDVLLLVGICLLTLFGGIIFLVVPLHLGFLLQDLDVTSPRQIGVAQALNSAAVVLGTLLFGWIVSPRMGVARQLALCAAIAGVGLIAMAMSATYPQLIGAAALEGVGCGLMLPTLMTWNMRTLPATRRGVGMGACSSSLFLGMFLNPLIVVAATDLTGNRATVVLVLGCITLGGAALSSFDTAARLSESRR